VITWHGKLFKTLTDEKGSAFIEYALWIALFVLVVAVAVSQLADATKVVIEDMIDKISTD
jgi:Flp pilus assembly pilin Flp